MDLKIDFESIEKRALAHMRSSNSSPVAGPPGLTPTGRVPSAPPPPYLNTGPRTQRFSSLIENVAASPKEGQRR